MMKFQLLRSTAILVTLLLSIDYTRSDDTPDPFGETDPVGEGLIPNFPDDEPDPFGEGLIPPAFTIAPKPTPAQNSTNSTTVVPTATPAQNTTTNDTNVTASTLVPTTAPVQQSVTSSPTVYPTPYFSFPPKKPPTTIQVLTPSPTNDPTKAPSPFRFQDNEAGVLFPTKPPTSTDDDSVRDDVKDLLDKEETELKMIARNRTAEVLAGVLAALGIIGMLLTAWQFLENPDGLCAAFCGLSVKFFKILLNFIFIPCKLCCSQGRRYNTAEYPETAEFVNDNDESNTNTTTMEKANEDRNVHLV